MEDRIEFDSVITEKALNDFKMYHVFHNVGGVFGYVFAAFKEPMHYSAGEDKIIVSQGDMSEELAWEQIYKIRFTGSNLILYLSSVRANVLTVNSMGEAAVPFVKMCQKKLKPFQVKVNMDKLAKAVA